MSPPLPGCNISSLMRCEAKYCERLFGILLRIVLVMLFLVHVVAWLGSCVGTCEMHLVQTQVYACQVLAFCSTTRDGFRQRVGLSSPPWPHNLSWACWQGGWHGHRLMPWSQTHLPQVRMRFVAIHDATGLGWIGIVSTLTWLIFLQASCLLKFQPAETHKLPSQSIDIPIHIWPWHQVCTYRWFLVGWAWLVGA